TPGLYSTSWAETASGTGPGISSESKRRARAARRSDRIRAMIKPIYEESPTAEPSKREPLTDFGYERVPKGQKKARVRDVFDSVAPRYDLMNDVMSMGLHRWWKSFTIARTGLKAGDFALDVAAGSGDLALGLARRVGPTGRVLITDINRRMLERGRDRLLDRGIAGNVAYVQADAEA